MRRSAVAIIAVLLATTLASGLAAGAPAKDYSYLFPRPKTGWTAEPVASEVIKNETIFGDALSLQRSYKRAKGTAVITIHILINDCLISGYIEAFREQGTEKTYEFSGYKGIEIDADGSRKSIALMVGPCNSVGISRENGGTIDIDRYLSAMDLKTIENFRDDQFSPQLWP